MADRTGVVVVGAGPVGLTAAALLLRRGVPVTVLERHERPYGLPRAVHLDGAAVDVLRRAGAGPGFAAVSRAMPGLRLVDARHRVLAEFRRAPVGRFGVPEASLFDQPDLDALLAATLPEGVVRRGVEVLSVDAGTGVVGTSEGPVRAEAVLGCDGADSTVARAVGGGERVLGPEQRWSVVDGVAREPLPMWDGVHQVCADPPATFLRVVGRRYRWEVREGGRIELPDGVEVVRSAEYAYRARVARRWRRGRVFRRGDAAHLTPPFAGQGLGAGLRDAANLCWKLAAVLRGGAPERLLDTYEAERAPHAAATVRTAVLLGWAMGGGPVRARLLGLAGRLPVAEVSPRVRRGPLVRRGGGRSAPGEGFVGRSLVRPDGVVAGTAWTRSGRAALRSSIEDFTGGRLID